MADELREGLEERLACHSAYFNTLIELIPVKHYLPVDEEELASKFFKNRQQKAPKQVIKEASRKAKRLRLDPNQHKTVHEIQKETEEKEKSKNFGDEEEGSGIARTGFSVEKVESGNLDELRSRLHARIKDFQRKRKAFDGKEEHKNARTKKSKSEVKVKNKQKIASVQKNVKSPKKQDSSPAKTILNDSGEVVFSKFDFMEVKKEPRHGTKAKNYSKLLAKAEAHKKKLETLKTEDAEKAKKMKEEHSWKHAMEKAEGVKQFDDPKLLKKAMKKREKEKARSKKQWKDRTDYQKKQTEEKQKVRKKHIQERIEAKKAKKAGKGKKKHRPGF